MDEEEWADEAGGFFAEFAAETTQGKSNRKRNREANVKTEAQRAEDDRQQRESREETAAAARQRIAATIASRASQKELRSLSKVSKAARSRSSTLSAATSSSHGAPVEQSPEFPRKTRTFKNKSAKLEQKLSRKEERKDQARLHALKNKKALRKGRR